MKCNRFKKVQQSDLTVGAEVGCGNLEGDLIIGEFVHLLCQKVGFSHQSVGFDNLLSESGKALAKKLIPVTKKQIHRDAFYRV